MKALEEERDRYLPRRLLESRAKNVAITAAMPTSVVVTPKMIARVSLSNTARVQL
jgi:hypothetical protein